METDKTERRKLGVKSDGLIGSLPAPDNYTPSELDKSPERFGRRIDRLRQGQQVQI